MQFGVVAVVNLVLGFLSPPVGLCFFVAAAVTGAKPGKMFIVTLPFFFAACLLLVLLSIFPASPPPSSAEPSQPKGPPDDLPAVPCSPPLPAPPCRSLPPGVLRAQSRDLRLGIITRPAIPGTMPRSRVAEVLKGENRGKLTMTVFHAGQLGNEGAMMQQLQTGALDMAFLQGGRGRNRVPNVAAILAPLRDPLH